MLRFITNPLKIIPNIMKPSNYIKFTKNKPNEKTCTIASDSSKKTFHSSSSDNPHHKNFNHRQKLPKTPDLIYMPHLYRWIKTKLRFKYLQKMWDPDFSEGAFIYGSTRAVCRITEIINTGNEEELEGLLTERAKTRLTQNMTKLTPTQKAIIRLRPQDIKIFVPMAVTFATSGTEGRACKVGLRVLALKWFENQANATFRLVLVALQTEFWRDYSKNAIPDWTINDFTVLECVVLTESTPNR